MKIEAGKFYRTRDGRKAGPVGFYSDENTICAQAPVLKETDYRLFKWDGRHLHGETHLDLIAEWVEPDDGWGEWVDSMFVYNHGEKVDVQYERVNGQWRHRTRPRKPVVETVTLYWAGGCAGPEQTNLDTHTITLTKIDGVWQRDAVLEEIK